MKKSLLEKYFDDNWFLNHVITALFRHKAEWNFYEMCFVAARISNVLKTPPMRSIFGHLEDWVRSGFAILETRDGKNFVRPGRFHNEKDIREVGDIPNAIVNEVEPSIQIWVKHREILAKYSAENVGTVTP